MLAIARHATYLCRSKNAQHFENRGDSPHVPKTGSRLAIFFHVYHLKFPIRDKKIKNDNITPTMKQKRVEDADDTPRTERAPLRRSNPSRFLDSELSKKSHAHKRDARFPASPPMLKFEDYRNGGAEESSASKPQQRSLRNQSTFILEGPLL